MLACRRVVPLQTLALRESHVDESRPAVRRGGDGIDSEPLHRIDAVGQYVAGSTGVGKTFIAQAVGLHACASGKSVLYMSITALQENLAIARSSGSYLRYRAKLAKFDLIIFDEMGMRKFTATEAQDLCEIIEERSIDKSVAFTSQLPVAHWNEVISEPMVS